MKLGVGEEKKEIRESYLSPYFSRLTPPPSRLTPSPSRLSPHASPFTSFPFSLFPSPFSLLTHVFSLLLKQRHVFSTGIARSHQHHILSGSGRLDCLTFRFHRIGMVQMAEFLDDSR